MTGRTLPIWGTDLNAADAAGMCHHARMERVPTPKDLRGAAAVAQSLAYVVGLAGVVAGGLVLRDGQVALAAVLWVLTFAGGAVLMIAAFLTRAMAALMGRIARIEADVAQLVADTGRDRAVDGGRDPWARHHPPT